MRIKTFALLLPALFILIACGSKEETTVEENAAGSGHKVTVEEVIQATSYTYLKVTDGDKEYWIAITKSDIEEGETIYHADGMEMKNFQSRDLDRTFESVYFVQNVSKQPLANAMTMNAGTPDERKTSQEKGEISVDPAEGGITISKLYSDRNSFAGKSVKVRGEVVKYNSGIMGRNWIHIQDGTKDGSNYDLTITTDDVVNVGDVATFEGTITLDKDFGAGYAYDVIMEEAKLIGK